MPGTDWTIDARKVIATLTALLLSFAFAINANAQSDPPATTEDAITIFNNGQDEHAKGNYIKAIELYEKALTIVPEFAEAAYQSGNAYLSLSKPAEAEKAFRRAVEIRGEWTLALAALGTVLERRGEYKEAALLLNKAIVLDDMCFPAYAGLVEMRLRTGAGPSVLRPLLDKIRVFSSKAVVTSAVFSTQAGLENALDDLSSAKKSVSRALAADPNNKAAHYLKAEIALKEKDLILAEETVKAIEKLDTGSEPAIVIRARLAFANGRTDDAAAMLSKIASPTRETTALAEKLALAKEQSTDVLEKALEKDPSNAMVLGRLCAAYRVSGPDKALDFCRRALEAEPKNIDHAIGYGAALLQAKRYDEAVVVLRRLSEASPDNSTIHANLGTALFQLKRYQEAKAEYQWLTNREPAPPIAYYFLAICYDQLGEYMDAGANYNLFLKAADASKNQLEIDKVKLRLPSLEKDIKQSRGKSKNKNGE